MNKPPYFPRIGDRVRLNDTGLEFVVVEVDLETQTASLLPAEAVVTVPLEQVRGIDPDAHQRKPRRPRTPPHPRPRQ
jgi:hypothetical protein